MVQGNSEPSPASSLTSKPELASSLVPQTAAPAAPNSALSKGGGPKSHSLRDRGVTPQPEGREALTSYQLQEASSHPASLQGHNSSERHIIHSAPSADPSPCLGSKLHKWQAWRMSHHTQPPRKPLCPCPRGGISPRNWAFIRKSTAPQGTLTALIFQ